MEDISSIVLIIFAILSVGVRLFRKASAQPEPEPEPPTPAKRNRKPVAIAQEEEESELPMSRIYDAPAMKEPQTKQAAKTPEMPKNPSISDDFDLAKAIIYSEILKPRTFDEA